MKIQMITVLLVMTGCLCYAVDAPSPEGMPPRNHGSRLPPNIGNWMGRQLVNTEMLQSIGVSQETIDAIREKVNGITMRLDAIDKEIRSEGIEQAKIAHRVLEEPNADTKPLIEQIEKIGKLRTEQAKISTETLVVMRDNLNATQRKAIMDLFCKESEKRIKEWRELRQRQQRRCLHEAKPPAKPAE